MTNAAESLAERLRTDLNTTSDELLRIRNECVGKEYVKIWSRMLQMITDYARVMVKAGPEAATLLLSQDAEIKQLRGALAQPMQPIVVADDGVIRFKANKIVRHLIDHGGIDLNALAAMDFSDEDRAQLAQLIGYSVSGFGDLEYAREETLSTADAIAAALASQPLRGKGE